MSDRYIGTVQRLINDNHKWEVEKKGGWRGAEIAPENRKTLYPNFIAEMVFNLTDVYSISCDIHVTPRLLCAVLEEGAELTPLELSHLSRRCSRVKGNNFVQSLYRYLSSPCLSVVDSTTKRGKAKLRSLQEETAFVQAELFKAHPYDEFFTLLINHARKGVELERAKKVIELLSNNQTMIYASYRRAAVGIDDVKWDIINGQRRQPPRDISA